MNKKVRVGIYGSNGHQINSLLENHPEAEAIAYSDCEFDEAPNSLKSAKKYSDIESLLEDKDIDLVSICSPLRSEQGEHILKALHAGKHVYAEKPCCLDIETLDQIIATVKKNNLRFHEMAGTAFEEPYASIKEIIDEGTLGEIIQVFSQKSYPWTDWRPKDESIDGGLALQVGIYNLRFAQQVVGLEIKSINLLETQQGNDLEDSDCRRAISFQMKFTNGAIGSAISNYCCPSPPDWKNWGYDILRIFGQNGFIESIDKGRILQIAINGQQPKTITIQGNRKTYLDTFIQEIQTGESIIPFTIEEELSPTRWAIKAKFQNK
jgi:predicted dehydrogenase